MIKKSSYAIWLMPTGNVKKRFSGIISKLSAKYNSSEFEPHITLVSGIVGKEGYVISKTEKLSKSIKPLKIGLRKVGYLNDFFRALFVKAKKSAELMKTAEKSRKIFNLPESLLYGKEYMPHLSLLYGNFDIEIKERIIREIGKNFNINFKVKYIYLVFLDKRIQKWRIIKKFKLNN